MKNTKRILSIGLTLCITLGMGMTAMAGTWRQSVPPDENRWWYDFDNGSYATGWQWIDGNQDGIAESYYFDENGWMLADTTTPDGYTVNSAGAWVENGNIQTKAVEIQQYQNTQEQLSSHNLTWGNYVGTFCSEGNYATIMRYGKSSVGGVEKVAKEVLGGRGCQYIAIDRIEGNRIYGELYMHGGFDGYSSSFQGVEISNSGKFQISVEYEEQGNSTEIVEAIMEEKPLRDLYSDIFTADCTLTKENGKLSIVVNGVSKYPSASLDQFIFIKVMDTPFTY